MEAKRWVFLVFLAFFLVGLSSSDLFVQDSDQQVQAISFISDLKATILGFFDGTWLTMEDASAVNEEIKPKHVILTPNLSTCHKSISDGDRPVYCCPPKRESLEPIIDFQFPDISEPIRVRRPAHMVDADYIAKYNRAIAIMKSLPYDDPRGYMHCIYCTGAYNQQNNSLLKIHRSWLFFPWHRMIIYFHERILGSLIGDENFALPFWNWDSPEGMFIPDMYLNGSMIDTQRDSSHLPPQVADINYDYFERGLGPEDQISTNVAFMYNQIGGQNLRSGVDLNSSGKRLHSLKGENRLSVQDSNGLVTIPSLTHFSLFEGRPTWNKSTLTYAMSPNFMIDYINRNDILMVLHSSFNRWSSVVQLNFMETQAYESADITIGFYYGDHGDGLPFTQGILAHAFAPEIGMLHFNADVVWSVDFKSERRKDAFDLESVATHEIGHLLGLNHSSDQDAVMFWSIPRRTKKRDLTADDILGVQTLYRPNPNYDPNYKSASGDNSVSLVHVLVSLIITGIFM